MRAPVNAAGTLLARHIRIADRGYVLNKGGRLEPASVRLKLRLMPQPKSLVEAVRLTVTISPALATVHS